MIGRKYFLNPETLRFERVRLTRRQKLHTVLFTGLGLIALAILLRYGFESYFPTPRQIIYERNNAYLRSEYVTLDAKLQDVEARLSELKNRDDRLYRSILSLEPLPSSIREAGTGGSSPYLSMRNFREPRFVMDVSNRIDNLSNRVQIQSSSLSNIYKEALSNQQFLACKPSINPVSPADPFWLTSSYGYRADPFNGARDWHPGIDISGRTGTDIHASGGGTVVQAGYCAYGYGKQVLIDHGYGYTTRYAHLDEILVKRGETVQRGEVIGKMGNTGRSTGTHLHYEVHRNGQTVNPMYFFYEDLSATEYTQLAARAHAPEPFAGPALSQK
jgi:murein DD-endopeptidase MepM/ murein hydrolase activator NlpD